jgi:hypothetical protein
VKNNKRFFPERIYALEVTVTSSEVGNITLHTTLITNHKVNELRVTKDVLLNAKKKEGV